MQQSQRNPGGSSPRHSSDTVRAEDGSSRQAEQRQPASEEREIERTRYRNKVFRDRMQEGDEGQGEWEGSARSW